MYDKKLHVVAAQFVLFKSLRISDFKCPRTFIKKRKLTTSEQSFSQNRLPQSFSVVNFVKFYHLQNRVTTISLFKKTIWHFKGFCSCRNLSLIKKLTIAFTANVNLYNLTKFPLYLSFTVHYNYSKNSRFTPILSVRIV